MYIIELLIAQLAISCLMILLLSSSFSSAFIVKQHRSDFSNCRRTLFTPQPTHAFVDIAGQVIDVAFRDYPYAMAALTCGVKASAADYVAQKRQLSKRTKSSSTSTEKKRNFAFLVYGAVYQGMGQEYIYNTLYPSWFGTSTTISTVLIKVLFDLLVQTTLLTLPVAYLTKALVYRYSAREAMVRYLDDIFRHGLLIKYFSLWGPVQCITFSIIPEHYRISFIAAVSFLWLILLSTISSREKTELPSTKSSNEASAIDKSIVNDNDDNFQCELADGYTCKIDG